MECYTYRGFTTTGEDTLIGAVSLDVPPGAAMLPEISLSLVSVPGVVTGEETLVLSLGGAEEHAFASSEREETEEGVGDSIGVGSCTCGRGATNSKGDASRPECPVIERVGDTTGAGSCGGGKGLS